MEISPMTEEKVAINGPVSRSETVLKPGFHLLRERLFFQKYFIIQMFIIKKKHT